MDNLVQDIVSKMISYFGTDVRRINHALKVYSFAQSIAAQEKLLQDEQLIIQIAAILHDIGIKESEKKYGSAAGKYQEIEGPPIAMEILKPYKIKDSTRQRIAYLIGHHHTYNKIEGIDFQILVESDFLVNIYEEHMTKERIIRIQKKYFKTSTGLRILKEMYL